MSDRRKRGLFFQLLVTNLSLLSLIRISFKRYSLEWDSLLTVLVVLYVNSVGRSLSPYILTGPGKVR